MQRTIRNTLLVYTLILERPSIQRTTKYIKTLNFYGVRGVGNDWIKSYTTNRKQFVEINGCASELLNVTREVPQGSILDPKLVVLDINDICNVPNLAKFIFFTDDTNIFW